MSEYQPNPLATEPEHIAISRSSGIQIDWRDGHHSHYGLKYLRDRCPCASCSGAHGTPPPAANPFELYKPALRIETVEPVGNYAIRIKWNDGHSSGIYSYQHFRLICPCGECSKPPATAV
ncbi:MAG: DUF971 domain-containing protein [Bryobacteraceae bacterium]|jgi:DUF971 family protein